MFPVFKERCSINERKWFNRGGVKTWKGIFKRILSRTFCNPIICPSHPQDRLTGMGNNNGLDMRSIEHCLSDIMRGVDAASAMQDPMKGKWQMSIAGSEDKSVAIHSSGTKVVVEGIRGPPCWLRSSQRFTWTRYRI